MGPRKRPKLDSKSTARTGSVESRDVLHEDPNAPAERIGTPASASPARESLRRDLEPKSDREPSISRPPSKAWYGRTLFQDPKAPAVTQAARKSIDVAAGVTSEAIALARAHTPPLKATGLRIPFGPRQGSRVTIQGPSGRTPSMAPATTEISSINAQSNVPIRDHDLTGTSNSNVCSGGQSDEKHELQKRNAVDVSSTPDHAASGYVEKGERPSSWFPWFSSGTAQDQTIIDGGPIAEHWVSAGRGAVPPDLVPVETSKLPTTQLNEHDRASASKSAASSGHSGRSRRSWLRLWNQPMDPASQDVMASNTNKSEVQPVIDAAKSPTSARYNEMTRKLGDSKLPSRFPTSEVDTDVPTTAVVPIEKQLGEHPIRQYKSSSWAFWSRDDGKSGAESAAGEVALADSPSQSKPEQDYLDRSIGVPAKVGQKYTENHKQDELSCPTTGAKRTALSQSSAPIKKVNGKDESESKEKQQPSNSLLPSFQNTYGELSRPGIVQSLTKWVPFASSLTTPKYLQPLPSPLRIKRAMVIGVHGYFPAPIVRTLLGQPTGTSIRFANSAASALQNWTQVAQGSPCEIDKVALEGEGKIADRIETLWGLLLNWIDNIRKADFVFVACHSQGCPVALMLVAKLLHFGCVSSAHIGVCAMAGVNQGPFLDYRSRWFGPTALELFDFAQQGSQVSKDYRQALDSILRHGVKILYVGSIDDQLVSMESSVFGIAEHPNIYRAVFVDGRVHAPDFLSHLVGFALKLRNLGVSDHGLIRELSPPLAGSLYGDGHSRIYEDEAVYTLAIEHTLRTMPCRGVALHVHAENAIAGANPYILPFAMRGLLEEDYVKDELRKEVAELIKQFDDWKPSSKVLKDVKFRLEGVKSKL